MFVEYTAQLNPLLPDALVRGVAAGVTGLELILAGLLLAGVWPRRVAGVSAALLATFAVAMTLTLGPKAPLDYSVFSAAAAAALLAFVAPAPRGAR